jgi:hypothetical protein
MAAESITQRVNLSALDAGTARQLNALLQSIAIDLAALKTAINTHQHAALNAAPSLNTVGTLNTNP